MAPLATGTPTMFGMAAWLLTLLKSHAPFVFLMYGVPAVGLTYQPITSPRALNTTSCRLLVAMYSSPG